MTLELVKPILPLGNAVQVSDAELSQFAALIYARTGIRVSPQKKTLLSNRLRRRLRETSIETFGEYYQHLKRLPAHDAEWDAFLQEITTHETYLFRDESQWNWFRGFLADLAAQSRTSGTRSLRIWSAACSTGDEPVTAATCVAGCLSDLAGWKVEILGTDIGVGAIKQASEAVFNERAMRLVPAEYRTRFFARLKDEPLWRAKPVLTNMIRYRRHNLMEPLAEKPFDLVFLKNVLIYFDAASKQTVMRNVRGTIRPGGLLMAGAAEGIGDLVRDMQRVQPWLYRNPLGA